MEKHEIKALKEENWDIFKNEKVPLTYVKMREVRHSKDMRIMAICWALSVILMAAAFVFLWLQYDTVSTTELSGVYNLVDSEGNVVSSDLAPDDVIRIIQELNGEGTNN